MILTPSRRTFLARSAGVAVCLALGRRAFGQPTPNSGAGDFRVLRAAQLGPRGQGPSDGPISAYDGTVPGPLLRARQGDEVKIRLVNELAAPTAIHWHGIRAPNAMDGVPNLTQASVEAGSAFDYRFSAVDAGTYWYHAPATLPGQTESGLYGALIVDEKTPVEVDRDVVLIVDEKPRPGENIATRSNERLRLRLMNVSTTRPMSFRFDRHAVRVMAIDGQPAEPFLAKESRVLLGPGNRIDVFVDTALAPGERASVFLDEPRGGEREIARLVYDRGRPRREAILAEPKPLAPNPLPERIDMRHAHRVDAPFPGSDSQKPLWNVLTPLSQFGPALFSVKRGRAVVLAFPNPTDTAYSVHLHGHHVRLLDNLDDGWKPFWLDTILTGPRRTTRVAFVADNPGKWLLHAQPLGGRDAAITAWFEVA